MTSQFVIDKYKSVSVSGHRILNSDLDVFELKSLFLSLIEKGFDTFLIGMALGFDTICFKVLSEIKQNININIVACIPCLRQSEKFTQKQKEEYDLMTSSADAKIVISEDYTPYCMHLRNKFMVDNSCCLVTYIRKKTGGTAYTVQYAKKQGLSIIYL